MIRGYRSYLLAVLLLILACNFVDRLALGVLLQDIKVELHLTDTQLGLLTGITFALFYSVMGIPIARWADRGNRVAIISITTALWSAAVALCGAAGSFLQLLLIRIGVAVGEAGCVPPAHSLIADSFTRAERPRAVAIYMLGGPLSYVIGYFVAGWLNELYGWRITLMMLGLPGVGLAALAWYTLREPRSAMLAPRISSRLDSSQPGVQQPNLKDVCITLWGNRTFRRLLGGYSIVCFFSYGILQWKPTFFIRSYGLQTGELGTWFAAIQGLGGFAGTYWGGALAVRYAANNESLQLKAIAIAFSFVSVVSTFMYMAPNYYLAFGLMALAAVANNATLGPLFGTIQTLVSPPMRATSIAVVYLCANLIGMGLGPLAAGVLSDVFRPWAGEESLRYALLALCPGYFCGGWLLWSASRTVAADLKLIQKIEPQDLVPKPASGL